MLLQKLFSSYNLSLKINTQLVAAMKQNEGSDLENQKCGSLADVKFTHLQVTNKKKHMKLDP